MPPMLGESNAGLGGWHRSQDLQEVVDPLWGQLDGLADSVDEPSEYHLSCHPTPIPFQNLFDRDGFLSVVGTVGGVQGPEDGADGCEKDAA
jgi:hypothetical protein